MSDEMVTVNFDRVIKDTGDGGARLLLMGDDKVWVPNSVIQETGERGEIMVPYWFARKEELI